MPLPPSKRLEVHMTMSDTEDSREEASDNPNPGIKRPPSNSPAKAGGRGNDAKRSKMSQDEQSQDTRNIETGGEVHEGENTVQKIDPQYDHKMSIASYLRPDVTAIILPDRDKVPRTLATYPPLILDGASGVGKTQQAFALLKGGHKVVYLLLATPTSQNSQPIYRAMDHLFYSGQIGQEINPLLQVIYKWKQEDLAAQQQGKGQQDRAKADHLSLESIENFIYSTDAPSCPELQKVMKSLSSGVLKYESGMIQRVEDKEPSDDIGNKGILNTQRSKLYGKVLFVDEALPHLETQRKSTEDSKLSPVQYESAEKYTPTAKDRLKFLRNLGRVLRMRVVLAGTGATIANMWTVSKDVVSGSSHAKRSFTWAVVEFLYRLVPDKDNNERLRRPLLHHWVTQWKGGNKDGTNYEDVSNGINTFIKSLGEKKTFKDETRFIWLSGACLSTDENLSSPFHLKPSALVQNHFFEPCLATCEYEVSKKMTKKKKMKIVKEYKKKIHSGKGFGKIGREISPLRLEIIKYFSGNQDEHQNDIFYWMLCQQEISPSSSSDSKQDVQSQSCDDSEKSQSPLLPPAISLDYNLIEYALTNCVQVCLATEPLFAFCISAKQQLNRKQFKEAISEALPETSIQRNRGALDGELHEQIIFAALQLSSNIYGDRNSQRTIEKFVEELYNYLRIESKEEMAAYNEATRFLLDLGKTVPKKKDRDMKYFYYKNWHEEMDATKRAEAEKAAAELKLQEARKRAEAKNMDDDEEETNVKAEAERAEAKLGLRRAEAKLKFQKAIAKAAKADETKMERATLANDVKNAIRKEAEAKRKEAEAKRKDAEDDDSDDSEEYDDDSDTERERAIVERQWAEAEAEAKWAEAEAKWAEAEAKWAGAIKGGIEGENAESTVKGAIEQAKKAEEQAEKTSAEMLFTKDLMPWLVPACKKELLRMKIAELKEDYFGTYDVAGLVPGVVNARMDADTIRWNSKLPNWAFEFRARANSYSKDAAMRDLREKMTEKVPDPDTHPPTDKEVQKDCHGMLIAITSSTTSRCDYCIVRVNGKDYLRVVVLIGNADG